MYVVYVATQSVRQRYGYRSVWLSGMCLCSCLVISAAASICLSARLYLSICTLYLLPYRARKTDRNFRATDCVHQVQLDLELHISPRHWPSAALATPEHLAEDVLWIEAPAASESTCRSSRELRSCSYKAWLLIQSSAADIKLGC